MTAYSFPAWFETGILSGAKRHTARALKRPPGRHVRPGEPVRLWTGLRTAGARLIAELPCLAVLPVSFEFEPGGARFAINGDPVDPETFAVDDGFADLAAMRAFWWVTHARKGQTALSFSGVLIVWAPPPQP